MVNFINRYHPITVHLWWISMINDLGCDRIVLSRLIGTIPGTKRVLDTNLSMVRVLGTLTPNENISIQ